MKHAGLLRDSITRTNHVMMCLFASKKTRFTRIRISLLSRIILFVQLELMFIGLEVCLLRLNHYKGRIHCELILGMEMTSNVLQLYLHSGRPIHFEAMLIRLVQTFPVLMLILLDVLASR